MTIILGCDEAGRGPLIGPLVTAAVSIEKSENVKLTGIGCKDSKMLTPGQREVIFDKIKATAKAYKITITQPKEIDAAVISTTTNLNWLEADKTIYLIQELKPDHAILDCPSTNINAYKEYIQKKLNNKTILTVEHKADQNYPVVAAASILAKVTRDREIEKIKQNIGINFGSGYPSDPRTQEFLKTYWKKHDSVFRKSWKTYQKVADNSQTKLI